MRPHHATFIISAAEPSGFPPGRAPEVAFVGRSNVGVVLAWIARHSWSLPR